MTVRLVKMAAGRAMRAALNAATYDVSELAVCTAGVRVDADGYIYGTAGSTTYTQQYQWAVSGHPVSDYEVRATVTSGSLTSGTAGSWLACSSDQTWTRQSGVVNVPQTVVITLEIRRAAAPNTILATASITLTAERYS